MDNLRLMPPADRSSPVAAKLFAWAEQQQIFFSHFEARFPTHLLAEAVEEQQAWPDWQQGYLAESKFQHFRLDQAVASFHPAHDTKWTAHEILHRLVGFFYRPGASRWEYLQAARLSESVPVAQYYFLEPAMQWHPHEDGELKIDPYHLSSATEFLTREWQAAAACIDGDYYEELDFYGIRLGSDAILYMQHNEQRLNGIWQPALAKSFYLPSLGCCADISSLQQRAEAIFLALRDYREIDVQLSAVSGIDRVKLDLAQRLITLAQNLADGQQRDLLLSLCFDELVKVEDEAGLGEWMQKYILWEESHSLLPAHKFFAVGYRLPLGFGFDFESILSGLRSEFPECLQMCSISEENLQSFVDSSYFWRRERLGQRFLAFLQAEGGLDLALDLFETEAFLTWTIGIESRDLLWQSEMLDLKFAWHPQTQIRQISRQQLLSLNFQPPTAETSFVYLKRQLQKEELQWIVLSVQEFDLVEQEMLERPTQLSELLADLIQYYFVI